MESTPEQEFYKLLINLNLDSKYGSLKQEVIAKTAAGEAIMEMQNTPENKLYKLLSDLNIKYEILEHEVITTMAAGKAIMEKLNGTVCLNLLLTDANNKLYLVIKNPATKLNIKALSTELNVPKMKMVQKQKMSEILQVDEGCATVFALMNDFEKNINVLIDKNIVKDQPVNFHPMRNSATITIQYDDMIKYIKYFGNSITEF